MRRLALGAALLMGVCAATPSRGRDAADPDLQHALDRIGAAPREAAGFADLAAWLFRRGDLERASAAAGEAARLDPESAAHHRLRGYLAAAAAATDEAEAAFRRAAEIEPASQVSLADFHLARAWAGYQEALRRGVAEPQVLQRLRDVAAAVEVSPELKTLVREGWPDELPPPLALAPPIRLREGVAVVVEKSTQTVRLYGAAGGGLALLKTYPSTTGQAAGAKQERGDLKTPDGVYVFSDLLPGDRLPTQYGALALPLNYPNAWDKRAGRSGHGIWFHGSDRLGSPFTPRDTQGCVILRNDDLAELAAFVAPGSTPVLIAERVADENADSWREEARRLAGDGEEPLAVVRGPEYALVLRRGAEGVEQELISQGMALETGADRLVLHDRVLPPPSAEWEENLRLVRPGFTAVLRDVVVWGDPARVEARTSAPVRPRVFRPELGNRLYIDLPGVSASPGAVEYGGSGVVERVRIATAHLDPPLTRLVIDLERAADYRIETTELGVVVLFGP